MDFSVSGSNSWETTDSQENFIESYFQTPKELSVPNTSGNNPKKKRKRMHDVNAIETNDDCQKKKKSVKLPIEKTSLQSTKRASLVKLSHSSKKKLKHIKCTSQSTGNNSNSESGNDFENCLINEDFQCTHSKSSPKTGILNKKEVAANDIKVKPLKKLTKSVPQEIEFIPLKSNTSPQKALTQKKKKAKKSSLKQNSEINEDLQDSKTVLKDAVQESDEELVTEIKNSDIFKEIKELMKQAPFLSNLKDSDESFGELSAEDSDEQSAEDTHESLTENTNSSLPISVKMIKTVKEKSKLSSDENKNLFSRVNTSNTDEEKIVPNKASNVVASFKEENDNKPIIRNVLNSKKTGSLLKNKAQEKLQVAKFRYLNEKLYTERGESAFKYFQENEDEFLDYHQGYSRQVSKWPMNPVMKIISDLTDLKKKTIIADMGCGDGKIAQTLHNMTVHSFDIVALNEFVTPCDISKVPLAKESVDIVVFCLSLMGTNLKDYLLEAHRILKLGGILKIAEVESRIENINIFIKNLKCLGFDLQNKDLKHKIFVFLDLKKVKKKVKSSSIPKITLRPCLYKKR